MLLDPGSLNIDASCRRRNCITVASIENRAPNRKLHRHHRHRGSGDITVDSNVALTWANASTLTLSAFGNINFQSGATIANTGSGNLVLRADNTGSGTGTVSFALGQSDQLCGKHRHGF